MAVRRMSLRKHLDSGERKKIARNWQLLDDGTRLLLRDVLPRLDLSVEIMGDIASEQRAECGVTASALRSPLIPI